MSKESQALDCPLCHKCFKNKHSLSSPTTRLDHLLCPVSLCGKSYQSRSKFNTHLNEHAKSSTAPDAYLCPRCDKVFVDIPIADLKDAIKARLSPQFDAIAAKDLILWRVSILLPDDEDEQSILLDKISEKKKLQALSKLSKVFDTDLPEGTIHIVAQRPFDLPLMVIVKPEKKVFVWATAVETATLDD
ncbi:hypothetical protein BGW38_005836 [Lunasporangiospora selenospora]|uniref:C2H2-type domain-containing protein n=1 Tax=Lunasporangiospora selenospora TaxID=979761 RepID=A0A9P6FMI4_9FUNG|nr:hypothetical protein BGW38_005836 [Lunasporangiospora selenospora]